MVAMLGKKVVDGYKTWYYDQGDSFKLNVMEGKAIKRSDTRFDLYMMVDMSQIDDEPVTFSVYGAEYEKYNAKEKKKEKVQPSEVELHLFNQLNDSDFIYRDGFSGMIKWYGSLAEYKGGYALINIDSSECKNLPAIPELKEYGNRSYADAGESQAKILNARRSFILSELNLLFKSAGATKECESFAEVFMLCRENDAVAKSMDPFLNMLIQICA